MNRREFLTQTAAAAMGAVTGAGTAPAIGAPATGAPPRAPMLAKEFVVVWESPDPKEVYAYSPGIRRLPNGRLIATMDRGGRGVGRQ